MEKKFAEIINEGCKSGKTIEEIISFICSRAEQAQG